MAEFAGIGGWFSLSAAVALVGVLTSAGLMPRELQMRSEEHEFWTVLSERPHAHLGLHWFYAAFGLAAIGVIPALYEVTAPQGAAWSWYAGAVGFLGVAVTARSHLLEVAWDRHIIRRYPNADQAYQRAVHVVAGYGLDVPDGFLQHGAVGVWVLISSVLVLDGGTLPTAWAWLGILVAALSVLAIWGYMAVTAGRRHGPSLVAVGIGGGSLASAAWFAWLGFELLA